MENVEDGGPIGEKLQKTENGIGNIVASHYNK